MATEQIVPLASVEPTVNELADAVRQLQRIAAGIEGEVPETFDPTQILERLSALETSVTQLNQTVNSMEQSLSLIEPVVDQISNPVFTGGFGAGQQWATQFGAFKLKGGLVPVPENQVVAVTFTEPFPVRSLMLVAVPITSESLGGIPIGYFRNTDYFTRTGFRIDNNRNSNWLWFSLGV